MYHRLSDWTLTKWICWHFIVEERERETTKTAGEWTYSEINLLQSERCERNEMKQIKQKKSIQY